MKNSPISTFFILFAVFILTSCSGNRANPGSEQAVILKGDIRIHGSGTVNLITEAVAKEFRYEQPKVKVTLDGSVTGGGFNKFTRGEFDINNASRPINF